MVETVIVSGDGSCEIVKYGLPVIDVDRSKRNFAGYVNHGEVTPTEDTFGGNTEEYAGKVGKR